MPADQGPLDLIFWATFKPFLQTKFQRFLMASKTDWLVEETVYFSLVSAVSLLCFLFIESRLFNNYSTASVQPTSETLFFRTKLCSFDIRIISKLYALSNKGRELVHIWWTFVSCNFILLLKNCRKSELHFLRQTIQTHLAIQQITSIDSIDSCFSSTKLYF